MPCGCRNKKNNRKNVDGKPKTSTKRLPLVTIRKRIADRSKEKK